MMNDEVNIKNLVIVERPLSKSVLKKVDIKQIPKPKCVFNRNTDIDNFVSPYARKTTPNDINSKIKPVINGCNAKKIDAKQHLNDNRDKNSPIDGWSASDIAKYRNEIQSVFKPETIEAIKNLSKKKTEKKSIDSQLLSKIAEACKEKPLEEKENEEMEVDDDKNSDVSFLPINPNNSYVNMDKLEMNKLEWMKYIDVKAEKSKLKSIRFHVTGIGFPPDEDDEELMETPSGDFDPFQDSLQHHGDEPHRKGYTISELFWLARSSFLMQRSVAVSTLTNMLRKSSNLEHVYHFNLPTVTQSLVDCGVVFLARWLIDDAGGEREQHLYQALDLIHAVVWNVKESPNCDNIQFDWPNIVVGWNLSAMKEKSIAEEHVNRLGLPISERTELKDDILLAEDLISCLVSNTYFLDRFSFLLVTKRIAISMATSNKLIEILHRIVLHSVDMACKLCNDHENLLSVMINTHCLRYTECTGNTVKLVRYLCQSSQSLAHKLTRDQKIIQSLYTFITEYDIESSALIECIRLVTVLLYKDIHIGPITTIMPSLLDQLNNQMINTDYTLPICRSILTCFTAFICSKTIISEDLYSVIKSSIIVIEQKLLDSLQSPESHHPTLASMLHLINNFVKHQYNHRQQQDSSCFTVASNLWHNLVSHLLVSPLLDSLLMKLSDFCVLGYEHRNSNLELINLDLSNMLHNSCCVAVKTRNPKFIDVNPFFIEMNPSFSLLSAISQTISLMASTRVSLRTLSNSDLISNFDAIPHLTKFINNVANCPVEKIITTSPHSAIVQLQLESVSQFIISVVDISRWANTTLNSYCSTILYKAAIKLLPYFGPRLHSIGYSLLNKVVFNPSIIGSMEIPVDQSVTKLLLSSISTVRQTYEMICFPNLQSSNNNNNNNNLSINDFFLPFNWIDYPFIKQFKQQQSNTDPEQQQQQIVDLTFSQDSLTALIAYISLLETGLILTDKIIPITGIRRLYHLFISNDWLDNFWDETPRLIITSFINRYLSNISLIDISSKQLNPTNFFDLYNSFCEQYFSQSFCDPLLGNLLLFPCAMRFPLKYRKTFWNINLDNMRLVTMEIGESVVAIDEYLQPEEVDQKMIQFYFELLKNEGITESRNQLLYWICVHHLNRFVFNRSLLVSSDRFVISLQQGLVHLLTNPQWENREWIKHVRCYKHFVGSTVQFYHELPVHRLEHLSKLQQLADVAFAGKSL